jgi:hypothetical protein
MKCRDCGEDMLGDGYTEVLHCADVDVIGEGYEPDADPVYCEIFTDYEAPSPGVMTVERQRCADAITALQPQRGEAQSE